jgi:hypothetical protein
MQTLKESILSSTNTGKDSIIRKKINDWCNEHIDVDYTINSNNEIVIKKNQLHLLFDNYTELPEYIQFADNDELILIIGLWQQHIEITSLRGLPKICYEFRLKSNVNELPSFEIKIKGRFFIIGEISKLKDIYLDVSEIVFKNEKRLDMSKIHAKNTNIIIIHSNYYSPLFSKNVVKNSILNKYTKKSKSYLVANSSYLKYPADENIEKEIDAFFGHNIDLSDLDTIYYNYYYKIRKYKKRWYKTPV